MHGKLHVDVSPSVFRSMWCGAAIFYVLCAFFFAFQAAVYIYIPLNAIALLRNLEGMQMSVNGKYFTSIAVAYVAVASVHLYQLVALVYCSVQRRQLAFPHSSDLTTELAGKHGTVARSLRQASSAMELAHSVPQSRLDQLMWFIESAIVTLWRSLRVTDSNYGVVYVVRELIQTAIQSYQAYRLSAFVARQSMNWVVVVLLVLNCWATPLIQLLLRASPGRMRLLCLIVNVALDFVASVVFPVALFLPYYADYNADFGTFRMQSWYTDVWLIQVINEFQMIFITSLYDALSRFFIAYNISRSMVAITRLLRCSRGNSIGPQFAPPSARSSEPTVNSSRASIRLDEIVKGPSAPTPLGVIRVRTWKTRVECNGYRLLAMWGLVVFSVHARSAATPDSSLCIVQVRPWLTTRPVCSLMEISCHDGQRTGSASDFDSAVSSIQREWLLYLVIRHCSAVEITPRIHDLSWMIMFKVYNSTLVSWDKASALMQSHNPHMLAVLLVSIRAQAVPEGLYHRDFPPSLMDIELSDWNVTSIPHNVVNVWPAGAFLVLERFRFSEFPPVLTQLRPGGLAISYNNFTEIPPEIYANDMLVFLGLAGNPIDALPTQPPASPFLLWISVLATNVSVLPEWVNPGNVMVMIAGSTPYCTSLLASDADSEQKRHYVNCMPVEKHANPTVYPLQIASAVQAADIGHEFSALCLELRAQCERQCATDANELRWCWLDVGSAIRQSARRTSSSGSSMRRCAIPGAAEHDASEKRQFPITKGSKIEKGDGRKLLALMDLAFFPPIRTLPSFNVTSDWTEVEEKNHSLGRFQPIRSTIECSSSGENDTMRK